MKKTAFLVAAATLFTGGQAIAGDCKKITYYGGANLGGSFMSSKVSSTGLIAFEGLKTSGDPSGRGFMGGLHFGADVMLSGPLTMGAEIGFDLASAAKAEHKSHWNDGVDSLVDGNKMSIQQRNRFTIATRLKYSLSDGAAPYVKLGYSNAAFRAKSELETRQVATELLATKKKRLGALLIGAGVDMKVNSNVRLGVEYTYANYGKLNLTHNFTVTNATKRSIERTFKPQTSTVQVRLSYTF